MIPILIPSRGRANDVRTIKQFPDELLFQTHIFVPREEGMKYTDALAGTGVSVHTMDYTSIGDKRMQMAQWAAARYCDKFIMVDDDVVWSRRRSPEETGLIPMEPQDFQPMLDMMYRWMTDTVGAVGISAREGNNRIGPGHPDELVENNTRIFRAAMFRTMQFLDVEHNRVPFMEDFDVMLQLLRSGWENRCLYYWAQDQRGTQTQGGCSVTRTHELHEQSAHRLAELHPGLVKLRQKTNKTGGSFGTRTEVTIAWKRALQVSR